jgi:hypothetical protein
MFFFGLKRFLRLTYLSLFKTRGTHARLKRGRIDFLVKFYTTMIPLQFIHWIGLLFDDLFFRGYRRIQIRQPVFIIGNPRAGTTRMLRVVAEDRHNFVCPHVWELLLAPSITEKKLIRLLARLDNLVGRPLQSRLEARESKVAERVDQYHQIRLHAHDEDELFFSPLFATVQLMFMYPFLEEFELCFRFDSALCPEDRRRFMAFYRRMIQRTLYANGPDKCYLSKAPSNNGRIEAIHQAFPDARIIYVSRSPLQVVPSLTSFAAFQWHEFGEPLEEYPFRDFIIELTKHWAIYPVEWLESSGDRGRYAMVMYDDLVRDPEGVIAQTYGCLDLEISPDYRRALRAEAEAARRYESGHHYSLEEMGLSREQIVSELQDVFDRFAFDPADTAQQATVA